MKTRNTRLKVTPENITELLPNEIFVFGSNLSGIHGGGAALIARNNFGAVQGFGEGITGNCYALPTKDKEIQTLSINEIHKSIELLLSVVKENSNKFFKITAVGCGLAGYEAKDIAPMFESFICLENISLPQSFIDVIFPEVIKGYKVTDENMKCRDVKFELNKTFSVDGNIKICNNGFHFCKELVDCFNYYDFNVSNRVFEVEGRNEFDFEQDKVCVREIIFLKELNWHEVLTLANTGKNNSGHSNSGHSNSGHSNSGHRNSGHRNSGDSNSGDSNSGHRNSGDSNSGHSNSGHRNSGHSNSGDSNSGHSNSGHSNSGHRNSGHSNSGDRNSGDSNSGHRNSGDSNSGDSNSGHRNSGDSNSGDSNSGHRNSGDRNSGDRNSGDSNSGHRNSGDSNSGHRNSGDSNSGHRNSGDYNSGNYNVGLFNTNEPKARLFNKKTDKKMSELNIPYIFLPLNEWIFESDMTDEEKINNKNFFVLNGYLKTNNYKESWSIAWSKSSESKKQEFLNLPNFDKDIFEEITGIKL